MLKKSVLQNFLSVASLSLTFACATTSSYEELPGPEKPRAGVVYVEDIPAVQVLKIVPAIPDTGLAPVPVADQGIGHVYSVTEAEASASPEVSEASAMLDTASADPDVAYAMLYRGNERYVSGSHSQSRTPSRSPAGESGAIDHAHTAVLSCSDAPVSPERLFDLTGRGGLFVVQVAGNVLGSAQVASLEHAVEKRGVKMILVLGHESCEAVRSALRSDTAPAATTDQQWLDSEIRPHLGAGRIPANLLESADPRLRRPVALHLNSVAESLLIRSTVIREAVKQGSVRLLRGISAEDSGRVDFWK